jgi:acetoacetate decarboxylase
MIREGKLTKDKFLGNMPVNTPLFAKLPQYFPNAEVLQIRYETFEEAVQEILPTGLEVSSPAVAMLTVFKFPFSTLGSYNEAALDVSCRWKGQDKFYTVYNLVTNDTGLAAGREIWGVPKKMAHIDIVKEFDLVMATAERPKGNRLFTALIRPEEPYIPQPSSVTRLSLKVFPSAEGKEPEVAELVDRFAHTLEPKQAWTGPSSLVFNPSEIDPWYRIGVKKILWGSTASSITHSGPERY